MGRGIVGTMSDPTADPKARLTHDDILACLRYASEMVHDFRHYKLGA